jgi:DNA-binding response OmpR family regulator
MPAQSSTLVQPSRANRNTNGTDVYDDGHLRVEHSNYYIACGGHSLQLPRKEFLIISRLARNVERTVAAEEIWRAAWGAGAELNAESLHVHIYRLRRKLAAHNLAIETMVGVGYRLHVARANTRE